MFAMRTTEKMSRNRTLWLALVSVLIAALVVAACQPAAPAPAAEAPAGETAAADVASESETPEPAAEGAGEGTAEASPEASATGTEEAAATEAAGDVTLEGGELVVYSGRSENLVAPLIEDFEEETGINVEVRYGGTAELAATILEEGDNSPADVFFAQDAGSLGALAEVGRLQVLPDEILDKVDARYRSPAGEWVGASGRARVLVYNTDQLQESDLPENVFGLTDPKWADQVGWAPTNGSFQSFVTAMRRINGDDATRQWLEDMIANGVQSYDNNVAIVEAVGKGEVQVGLVNHYYLYRFLEEQGESFPARNYYFPDGGADALVNVAGAGVLNTTNQAELALRFVDFLLSTEAQQYFASETVEYPLITEAIEINPLLRPLAELNPPQIDLSDLSDLQGTLEMLQDVGALQ
jgi:iron(III) transport system substrate-binding protein